MHGLIAVLALAASVAGADVQLVWQHAKTSGQEALGVYDGDKLVAQSCSSFIKSAPHSIDFSDVDDRGFGNFTVGEKKYLVHSKAEYSGGPTCTRKYDDKVTVVECSGLDWVPSSKVEIDEDCHDDEDAKTAFRFLTRRAVIPQGSVKREANPIVDPPDCNIQEGTFLVGDGNPHQNYFHKQLSEVVSCGNSVSCTVGQSESTSYTIGWSASLTPFSWISGTFSVSETWTTGSTYSCTGAPGEDICVWYNTAHTAYTVQNKDRNLCDGSTWYDSGDPFVLFSPNSANRGGGYYCVIGTCRAQGDGYWDYSGRAGGP
ncbi:hypothetical protein AK830_g2087 [Neonectria ditissima]|uniref:Ig-like domain-containing protein n=1 Tax=Neonectria ditissima TaxID=78410 RepID=A0A0N8H8F6_9HYPO|nr:hypothetical protein AK830_g2087 [Neonectria ditissima]